jgi:hypothetical protein
MGQGYSLITLPAASAGIDVPEMADIAYEKSLGNARFMKCIRARHKNGLVIAKVVMKPYPQLRLDEYVKVILGIYGTALIRPADVEQPNENIFPRSQMPCRISVSLKRAQMATWFGSISTARYTTD